MKKRINDFIYIGEWVCIYTDIINTSKFIFGRVLAKDEINLAIQMLSPSGADDGILVKRIDSIFRIEADSKYVNKMLLLKNGLGNVDYSIELSEDIIASVLKYCIENNQIVSLEIEASGFDNITGKPIELNDFVCTIRQYNEYGEYDGFSHVEVARITQLCFNSLDEKTLEELVRIKQAQSD